MPRITDKLYVTGLAMLFLPIIMVKILAVTLGVGSPSQASATSQTPTPIDFSQIISGNVTDSEARREAQIHVDHLRLAAYGEIPLLYGKSSEREATSIASPAKTHTLQMIMATSTGNVALIDRAQYRIGDQLDDEPWRIASISNEERKVVLVHMVSGKEVVLNVD